MAVFEATREWLYFDDALWGGSYLPLVDLLAHARVGASGVIFDFGSGSTIMLEGVTSIAVMDDDFGWF